MSPQESARGQRRAAQRSEAGKLIDQARRYATQAHDRIDHRRKYNNQPYEVHLKAVAEIVASVTDDPEMIAAAWLHDTVEDTPATFGDIEREFGHGIVKLVNELTDVSRPSDGNRTARKSIDRAHLAGASTRAKTIKLADLIDNCRDICRHDPRFARVYLVEMRSLLEVLEEGDERLLTRARRALTDCAQRLGLPALPEQPVHGEDIWHPQVLALSHRRAQRLFTEAFTARDIAEPLRSFDDDRDCRAVAETMARWNLNVATVRAEGTVAGYLRRETLGSGPIDTCARPFSRGQLVAGDAGLAEVIQILTRYDFCFVTAFGEVNGFIGRGDIQKPIVRMWLFGIVTIIEMDLVARIRTLWPDGGWTALISTSRLDRAQQLLEERRRRGQHVDLLDCLQFSDKAKIVIEDPHQLAELGFSTKGVAKRVIKELESLRNNLAHSQDIVTHDWAQIARLAQRVEELLAAAS